MDAMKTYDFLLSLVKKTNLNFSITESPFSVSFRIIKSFIKLRNTMHRTETLENIIVNKKLQDEYDSLLKTLSSVENDKEELAVSNHEHETPKMESK